MAGITYNKPEVIRAIAEITGGTQKEAEKHLDALQMVVENCLAKRNTVKIVNFCIFEPKEVTRTQYVTPDGLTVEKEPHYKPHIKASKRLKSITY